MQLLTPASTRDLPCAHGLLFGLLQDCQAAVDEWERAVEAAEVEGGLPPSTGPPSQVPSDPSPLSVISACVADLQCLYSRLPWHQRPHQLPLVMALGANALAFSAQVLEAEREQRESTPDTARSYQGPQPVPPGNHFPSAFGRSRSPVSGSSPPGPVAARTTSKNETGFGLKSQLQQQQPHAQGPQSRRRASIAAECFTRAASLLSFLFPLDRNCDEWLAAEAEEPRSYPSHTWPQVASQAAGALGALELALRSGVAPSPAVQVMLLHALVGVLIAAPGSFWVSGEGSDSTCVLSTLRKVANQTAQRLEVNVAAAEAAGQDAAHGSQYPGE